MYISQRSIVIEREGFGGLSANQLARKNTYYNAPNLDM